jgi:hypothetical protein
MALQDNTFHATLQNDATVQKWLTQLLQVVGPPVEPNGSNPMDAPGNGND